MIYDPKTVFGDVIASLYGMETDENGLLLRFDNHNGILHRCLLNTLNALEQRGLIRRCKDGTMRPTKLGIKFIKKHGYFD